MSKTDKYLCLRCHNYVDKVLEAYWETSSYGFRRYYPATTITMCKILNKVIRKCRLKCKYFLDVRTSKLIMGVNGTMKVDKIEVEPERIELDDLPETADLIAIEEKYQEQQVGRTGGLIITFKLRDKRQFQQKYSKVSGAVLVRALNKLKIKDTEELQKNWYKYKLTPMRIGFARMIPTAKV